MKNGEIPEMLDRAMRGLSLQSEHFTAGQEANGLLEAPDLRVLALGGLDPCNIPPLLRRRQRFEVAQGFWMMPQRRLDVRRKA